MPAHEKGKEEPPSPSLLPSPGHAAADLGARPEAGQDSVPGSGLDSRYEQLRHAALHARSEAFPLGIGVLTGKGVTAWQRALAEAAPARPARAAIPVPAPAVPPLLATELTAILASLVLGGT